MKPIIVAAALAVVFVALPHTVYPVFATTVLCFALFACAFNLLVGYSGLLSFGHAAYFGTSAYVTAHVAKEWGLGVEISILAGLLASTLLGAAIGAVCVRKHGLAFSMTTLASAQLLYFVFLKAPFTGGENGIQAVPRGQALGLLDLGNDMNMYYFCLVVTGAAFWVIYRVVESPYGEVLRAIQDNEPRAVALGYNVTLHKWMAFVISAAFSGLAGSLKAITLQFATLTDVHWAQSGHVILMTLIGGIGTLLGPIFGAALIVTIENFLAGTGAWVTIITGVIFVLCVLGFKRGILGELMNMQLFRKRTADRAARSRQI